MPICSRFLISLGVMLTVTTSFAQSPRSSFSLTISTPAPVVASGSQLKISIILKNVSGQPMMIARSNANDQGGSHYTVIVFDGLGKKLPMKKPAWTVRRKDDATTEINVPMGSTVFFPLKPGELLNDEIFLSKMYDLTKPGKYEIQVQRTDPTSKVTVKSNTITVTLTP